MTRRSSNVAAKFGIIVVDDDRTICTLVREYLEEEYEVFLAETDSQALRVIKKKDPEISKPFLQDIIR